ncbi:MAG: type III secretion system chaperone [Comamonadaceae bacterium]|nr:type III secretion system chaperone [Comamonadaceae bacterium]
MSSFEAILASFGEKIGITGLVFDREGCCRLVFDGQRVVEVRASNPQRRMVLNARVGAVGATWPSGTERLLLQANSWGSGTGGGWFSIDERGQVCLQHEVPLSPDSDAQLLAKIEATLNSLELWERRLSEGGVPMQAQGTSRTMQRV